MKRKKDEDDDGYLYSSINMKFFICNNHSYFYSFLQE